MGKKMTVTQSAILVSIFTLISKFLGFIREIMIASKFGSGMETDTYFIAMTATVIVVGALGSALNTTLIPIFSDIEEKFGHRGKLIYLNNIINLVLLMTLVMVLIGYFASPLIISVLAKGFEGKQFDLAIKLNRIGLPIVLFLSLTHILTGFLHSNKIFGPSAVAGIPYNIAFLFYLGFFASNPSIEGLMMVTVIGSFLQLLVHLPPIFHMGYEFSPGLNLRDPFLRKAMRLIGPVLLGSAVQQINLIVDKTLASELREGSLSALTYSARINDMVIAVFIMAITTVIFPMLAEAFARGDNKKIKEILGEGIGIILLITVPATVGIIFLAEPLVYLFFERNAFDATATLMTSRALVFYSLGLIGTSLRLILNRVYYSLHDTVTPMINGIVTVILNIILNLILIKNMSYAGLALATSISITITSIFLLINLRRKIGPLGVSHMLMSFLKIGIASIIMGGVVYLVYFKMGGLFLVGRGAKMGLFILSVLLGVMVYFFTCMILKVKELSLLFNKIRER